jgi:hypothetical protein
VRPLVVGNSHVIGFKHAAEARELAWPYVPIPLCTNFREAVEGGTGRFELSPLWRNMAPSSEHRTPSTVHYDISNAPQDGLLIIVGERLFGCFPIFRPLIIEEETGRFTFCAEGVDAPVPGRAKYQLVSRPCLELCFLNQLHEMAAAYGWLLRRFRRSVWIPSPPPSAGFASSKFLPRHHWYITSGHHRVYVSIFNQCVLKANESADVAPSSLKFFTHRMDCIDENGFLQDVYRYAPNLAQDIHASGQYYDAHVAELAEVAAG